MRLFVMPGGFSICRLCELPDEATLTGIFRPVFLAVADDEISLVCQSPMAPTNAVAVDDGWSLLRVAGPLDFTLVGIVAELSGVLAQAGVPINALSTYRTDYLLVKTNRLSDAVAALEAAGHDVA